MNLSVKRGLAVDGVKEVIASYRRLVGFFNHRNLASEALKSKQKLFNLPERSLKQDVETR